MLNFIYTKKNNALLTLIILFFTLAVISQLPKIKLLTEYSVYFDDDNQAYTTFTSLEKRYTKNDNIFVVVQAPDGEDIFTEKGLSLLFHLTEESWNTPYVSRVDSITNFIRSRAFEDDIEIEELLREIEDLNNEKIDDIKNFSLKEPLLINQLISKDASVSAVNLTMNLPGINQNKETSKAVETIKNTITTLKNNYPEYRFYTSGLVMLNNTFFKVSSKDLVTLIPIMMLIILIIASLLLRSWLSFFALTLTVILSALASLGAAAILDINLTSPSISAPIILLTISVASGVHIIVALKREIISCSNKNDVLTKAIRKCGLPVTLTNFTTIIGFLSMNLSDSPPFRDLGNIVALGIVFSWALSMVFIPWIMLRKISKQKHIIKNKNDFFSILANKVNSQSKLISYLGLPLVIIISSISINNSANDNFVEYFDENVPFRAHTELIDKKLTGIHTFEFSIETKVENGILQPEALLFADKFANWLRQQKPVVNVYTLTDVIKDINQSLHADNINYHVIPKNKEEAMQYFLLYEISLPYGKDINDRINMNKSSIRTTARLSNIDTQGVLKFENKVDQFLKKNTPDNINVVNSSLTTLFTHVGLITINSLIEGALIALLIVSITLMLFFRSFKKGMLSIIPNLIPIGLAFGLWGIFNGEISMGLATVCAMTIGIVVDDTIHFLHHYFNFKKSGFSTEESCKKVLETIGPAILVSSIVLSVGFFILSFSYFEKNALMGLLTSITIILALIADTILLPALLIQWNKLKSK